jgi:hypothetical protein
MFLLRTLLIHVILAMRQHGVSTEKLGEIR